MVANQTDNVFTKKEQNNNELHQSFSDGESILILIIWFIVKKKLEARMKFYVALIILITLPFECASQCMPQVNQGGSAVSYPGTCEEIPNSARPNDATISLYEERRGYHIATQFGWGNIYQIPPKDNAVQFVQEPNIPSQTLEKELAKGYILSYLYYSDGVIKYNGKAADGRFERDISDKRLFFTHSTGKSIVSYIVGHAICDGYISSMDEIINWPMMSNTLYQGQPLRNLLNMRAGDEYTVDADSVHVMGSRIQHRNLGLDTIAASLNGTKSKGNQIFYNNFLSDVIANYVAFKAGDNYDKLILKVFQDKVKIEEEVLMQKHTKTTTNGVPSPYYGQMQTRASYSFYITRMDLLRVAVAMMKDYQEQTCVGKYLKEAQSQAKDWYQGRMERNNSRLWINSYAGKYGAQIYFNFYGMSGRNILATEGYNGQNMMIDMDNSRIVVTNSAATGWDQPTFILNVIKDGKLPK